MFLGLVCQSILLGNGAGNKRIVKQILEEGVLNKCETFQVLICDYKKINFLATLYEKIYTYYMRTEDMRRKSQD